MGDRALVIFHDQHTVSPTCYLHWDGSTVPRFLEHLKDTMQGREGDASYAAARFLGICHAFIPGNLSIGVWSNSYTLADLANGYRMAKDTHGDAGVVVVNTDDFSWKAYGGYLADETVAASVAA